MRFFKRLNLLFQDLRLWSNLPNNSVLADLHSEDLVHSWLIERHREICKVTKIQHVNFNVIFRV